MWGFGLKPGYFSTPASQMYFLIVENLEVQIRIARKNSHPWLHQPQIISADILVMLISDFSFKLFLSIVSRTSVVLSRQCCWATPLPCSISVEMFKRVKMPMIYLMHICTSLHLYDCFYQKVWNWSLSHRRNFMEKILEKLRDLCLLSIF